MILVDLLGRYSKWTYWKKNAQRIFGYTIPKHTNPPKAVHACVRKLSASEIARLAENYQAGATITDLAAAFKIHRTTVSQHLLRSGTPMRRQGLSEEQVATAASLYQQGWSLVRLGERFDVDPSTVHAALRRVGLQMRKPWEHG